MTRSEPTTAAERDQVNPQAGREAAAALWKQAGITNPYDEIDCAEIYVPFSWFEPMWLENLGFVQSPTVAGLKTSGTGFSVEVSSEQLDLLDADLIVAFPIFVPTTSITDDPLWRKVPAVAAGHAVVIDGELSSAYSLGTTLATTYAIERLVPQIEKALG